MLTLPLALFLGVLLAYGKLYLDSEMTVLRASGVSSKQLVGFALGPAIGGALIVASLSLYISPIAFQALELSYAKRDALNELDTLTAGRFQKLPDGRTVYTSAFLEQRSKMDKVFIAKVNKDSDKLEISYSDSGAIQTNADGRRYLVLQDGYRYTGTPGMADYQQLKYFKYGYLLPERKLVIDTSDPWSKSTLELLGSSSPELIAELQWRLSLPLLAFVVVLIAVPLSRTSPRQGRYSQLIPSILLYLVYLSLLMSARDKVDQGGSVGLIWIVHAVFFVYGMSLIFFDQFWIKSLNKLPNMSSLLKRNK